MKFVAGLIKYAWDCVLDFVGGIPASFLICIAAAFFSFTWGMGVGYDRANQRTIEATQTWVRVNSAAADATLVKLDAKYAQQAADGKAIVAQLEQAQRALVVQNDTFIKWIATNGKDLPECRVSPDVVRLLNDGVADADTDGVIESRLPPASGFDAAPHGAAQVP